MILFCIPYAGGSARDFADWEKSASNNLQIVPLELRARGKRIKELAYTNFDEMVTDLCAQIDKYAEGKAYSIWGHSMGAITGFAIAKKRYDLRMSLPKLLFLSGRDAPFIEYDKKFGKMTDLQIKNYLCELHGTSLKVFDEPRVGRIYLNRVKGDYQVLSTYNAEQYNVALPIDMLIFYGTDDISIKGDIRDWREYTTQEITFFHFKSGHFYSDSQKENVLQIIEQHI